MMKYVLILILSLYVNILLSQEITVCGQVISTDENIGEIPGATVILKDTTIRRHTLTDINGYYHIKVNISDTLQFSFSGFITQSIPVRIFYNIKDMANSKVINVKLEVDPALKTEKVIFR